MFRDFLAATTARAIGLIACASVTAVVTAQEAALPTVVINEFMSSNSRTLADPAGDFGDWIELFNAGSEAVDLAGWGISDQPSQPFRWVFPSVVIQPGGKLIVWADGKDRVDGELTETFTLVPEGSDWRYLDNGSDPGPGWRSPGFADGTWRAGPAPLGYGPLENYVKTTVSFGSNANAKHITTFFRSAFQVARPEVIRSLSLSLWVDDGAIVYLNGGEVVRENMPVSEPALNTLTPTFVGARPTWKSYSVPATALLEGSNTLAVRVHQVNGTSSDMAFDLRLEGVRPIQSLHTNFSISSSGEPLLLTAPDGRLVDYVAAVELPADVSYGRASDGGSEWRYFSQATPGASNATATGYLGISPPPAFSHASGFHADPFQLALHPTDPDTTIYYTLDGSDPGPRGVGGKTYAYTNSYPNGPQMTGSTEAFRYVSPIPIALRDLPYGGIKAINTENSPRTDTPSAWSTNSSGHTVQSSLKENVRLMFGDPGWSDYEITMQGRKDEGLEGFLVFVRANGPLYYLINFGGWGNSQHGLEKGRPNGSWDLVAPRVSGSVATGSWINLRIRCEGNRIRAWLGSQLVIDFTDSSGPYLTGGVGIGTWRTASRYRNIEVRTLDGQLLHSGPPLRPAPLTVVRARAFKDGHLASDVVTGTFFHGPPPVEGNQLPLVSLAGEEADFFSYAEGISVAGAGRDARNVPHFLETGPEWERPLHLTVFEPDGALALAQDAGARIHGGWTRNLPQKSLRLYARAKHGEGVFKHPIFPNRPVEEFKRLVLRNSGNDNGQTMFRDAMMQRLVEHLPIDTQDYRPAVVYLNGNYWGIHNFRERQDNHYLAGRYGLEPGEIDILGYDPNSRHHVIEGDAVHFDQTLDDLTRNNPADPVHYEHLRTRIDTDNFIDYNLSQIYFNNTDWPGNNNRWWRKQTSGYDPYAAPGHDGRWRWMLFDTDFGFGHSGGHTNNTLAHATTLSIGRTAWPNPEWSTLLLRRLLENTSFRNDFINRYCDLLNTAFLPERVVDVIDGMAAVIEPEMPRHISRWGRPLTMPDWRFQVDVMRNFARNRPGPAREHLRSHFSLGADRRLTLDVSDTRAGHVRVNQTPISPLTPGVNATAPYPWTGRYFGGVPLRLTAVAAPGYRFSHWQVPGVGGLTSPLIPQLVLSSDMTVTAVFEEARPSTLMHYWSFNRTDALLAADFSIGAASLEFSPGPAGEMVSGSGQGFTGVNAQLRHEAGSHLRLNQPLGSTLVLRLPTTGYENAVLRYETRRSGQGAGLQLIASSVDGVTFSPLTSVVVLNDDPALVTIPLGQIPGANRNPNFALRFTFSQGAGGTGGNNRFDNLTLTGEPLAGTNVTPQWLATLPFAELIEGAPPTPIDLSELVMDLDGDALQFSAQSTNPEVIGLSVTGSVLALRPQMRGEAEVTITVSDGVHAAITTSFRVLVHPAPHPLAEGGYRFDEWSAAAPAGSFPAHMIFLQSDEDDPGADVGLLSAYHIPAADAAEAGDVDFPYGASSRTRINGLGEGGISFLNTGRGRGLGGAILALDTRGVDEVPVEWLAGTVQPNSRHYAIRLQYRLGISGPFRDVFDESMVYQRGAQAGLSQMFGPRLLPEALLGQAYVQLLWRYHWVSGEAGSRDELRLDDIRAGSLPDAPPAHSFEAWRLASFDPSELDDPAVSGLFADPLHSGVPNLLRHAFGLGPDAPPHGALPSLRREQGVLRFSHRRLIEHEDLLAYQIERSETLGVMDGWVPVVPGDDLILESIVPNGDGLTEQVTYRVAAAPAVGRMFLRLRVSLGE
jgi:hypothetical protein